MVWFYSILVFFLSYALFRRIRNWSPGVWLLTVICWTAFAWLMAGVLRDFHAAPDPIEPDPALRQGQAEVMR